MGGVFYQKEAPGQDSPFKGLAKEEFNALASFQTTLGNVTSLNAQAASADIQKQASERNLDILDQSIPLKQGLFDLQQQSVLLNRSKQVSDINRQTTLERRRLFIRQPAGLLQLDDMISEGDRRISFVAKEAGIANNRIMAQRGLEGMQQLQQALSLSDQAKLAGIQGDAARSRAESTLLAGKLRLGAAQTKGGR